MALEIAVETASIGPEVTPRQEVPMVRQERWEEIRRLWVRDRVPVAEIARRLDLDRKTIRRCLRDTEWKPYRRAPRPDTLLAPHADYLRARAPQVRYSAQILFQELRQRGYRGSYDTVKLFVQPLRAARLSAERALTRFETPPGQQSQLDWGTATVPFRARPQVRHVFVLTLGFSRRSYYRCCPNETLPQFLDAHERAFEYFGGHTREHLYDRPRTVCLGTTDGRIIWNATFKAFAEYWSFEPRVCPPYRAQTKGKVQEHAALVPTASQPSFRLEAPLARIVAEDYLVSVDTNRYSVPFTLIGQTVEVRRRAGQLVIVHRGARVAEHPELPGRYQLRLLPEHGPGASARTARRLQSTRPSRPPATPRLLDVEVRDLALYEALMGHTDIAAPLPNVAPGPTTEPGLAGADVRLCTRPTSNASRST